MVEAGAGAHPLAGQLVRLVFLLAGIGFLAWGVVQAVAVVHRLQVGVTAPGTIAAATDPAAERAHPMIQFTTAENQVVRYRQNGYRAAPGESAVTILYDPRDPGATAVVESFSTLWLPVLLPLGLGGAAAGLAIASFVMKGSP